MVFGFGKKKTVESSISSPSQQKEILVDDVESILKEVESPSISKIIEQAKKIRNEIKTSQQSIKDVIFQLESDDLKLGDVDKNLKTTVKRGKDTIVSTIKKETTTTLVEIRTYEDIVNLSGEVNQLLKRMGDVLGLHTRVMHVFARKYADKLKDNIAKLSKNRSELQTLLNEREDLKSKTGSVLDISTKIKKLKDETAQKNKRLTETLGKINETQKIIQKLDEETNSLKSKNEYKEFLAIKRKIELLSDERIETRNKINDQLSKISRPLSKYSYVSSFDKPMKKLMEDLLLEPYSVISIQNKASIIEILHAVTKSVLAGNVSVKDSQKTVEQIEETINRLDEFLVLKNAYADKLSELEKDLAIFDASKLEEKERNIAKAKINLSDLESSSKRLEKEISENDTAIQKFKAELESTLSILHGTKIIVKL